MHQSVFSRTSQSVVPHLHVVLDAEGIQELLNDGSSFSVSIKLAQGRDNTLRENLNFVETAPYQPVAAPHNYALFLLLIIWTLPVPKLGEHNTCPVQFPLSELPSWLAWRSADELGKLASQSVVVTCLQQKEDQHAICVDVLRFQVESLVYLHGLLHFEQLRLEQNFLGLDCRRLSTLHQ